MIKCIAYKFRPLIFIASIALDVCSVILVLGLSFNTSSCQGIGKYVISNGGKLLSNDMVTIQWTIGEIAVNRYNSENIVLDEGFHAGTSDNSSTSIVEITQEEIFVYPNPASDIVFFNVKEQLNEVTMILVNVEGKILLKEHQSKIKSIRLNRFPKGMYTAIIIDQRGRTYYSHIIKQ
ncbi:MAG: T9SS type A sorting domain-containing protein [Saprospiraceae bacterium]|nr:T9SS type A sorting domain-containing protein [Saprospiraceae bacterium]